MADVIDLPLWEDFPFRSQVPPDYEIREGTVLHKDRTMSVLVMRHPPSGKHIDIEWQPEFLQVPTTIWLKPMIRALEAALGKPPQEEEPDDATPAS